MMVSTVNAMKEVYKAKDEILIDFANRKVTVTSYGHRDDLIRLFSRGNTSLKITDPKCCISDMYRGTARCHPDDEFDEDTGIFIATKRMQQKIYQAMLKRMTRLSNEMSRTLEDTTYRLEKIGTRAYEDEVVIEDRD